MIKYIFYIEDINRVTILYPHEVDTMPEVCGNMTGVIADILVHKNDKVESGQDVIILESMKMHIPIQSDLNGIVKEIKVDKGDVIKPGQPLLILE